MYIHRLLEKNISHVLGRGKSILLLGPRQTGKTTLINKIPAAMRFSLANPRDRLRYEKEPFALTAEVEHLAETLKEKSPLVIIDEIQKVPILMDAVQDLIDRKIAKFIVTGSSARKLRRSNDMNLLPGRVIPLRLDPLVQEEFLPKSHPLDTLLIDGSLPEILLEQNIHERENMLDAYVMIYLEEEIRAEAIVRDLANFSRFLELAASESGKIANFSKLSQEIGVTHATISSYYQILEDCLVAERIEPLTQNKLRRKLTKTQKYLMYDMGVRRIAAREGRQLSREQMGHLFEQYVGLELIRLIRLFEPRSLLKFWRDPGGPEVDWVLERAQVLTPIEVKWTKTPSLSDIKYLQLFLEEYKEAPKGYLICQTPHPMKLTKNIYALPWEKMAEVLD